MLDWDNWSVKERCVGELILEMFEAKDPSGKISFQPKDIYDGYYDRLKEMWMPKQVRVQVDDKVFTGCSER